MAKEVTVYSLKKDSTAALPASFLAVKSLSALAQAFHVYRDRKHPGLAMTRTRGEVALTTKKMYRQKHTGNARHGAATAPIFVGGGVTHGPRGVKRMLTLPKHVRVSARNAALSMKAVNNEVAYIDMSGVTKTKYAAALFAKTGAKSAVVALMGENTKLLRVFRNIPGVKAMPVDQVNAYDLMLSKILLLDSSLAEKKVEKKESAKKQTKKATK
jgi:large subunit ribosomal protein L4